MSFWSQLVLLAWLDFADREMMRGMRTAAVLEVLDPMAISCPACAAIQAENGISDVEIHLHQTAYLMYDCRPNATI